MKKTLTILALLLAPGTGARLCAAPPSPETSLNIKQPGNPAAEYTLSVGDGQPRETIAGVTVRFAKSDAGEDRQRLSYTFTASESTAFHFSLRLPMRGVAHETCDFLLPGLWYRQNLQITKGAPSMSVSRDWLFREDRLSTPLAAAYDPASGTYCSVLRADSLAHDALQARPGGDVIRYGEGDLGSLGFGESAGEAFLACAYPVCEAPYAYSRKLTLSAPVRVFRMLNKGESVTLSYEIAEGRARTYTDFVRAVWQYAFDMKNPQPVATRHMVGDVKRQLAKFYAQSFTGEHPLKGYSGVELRTDSCEKREVIEVGFVGRVLLNAYYALQYGEQTGDSALARDARAVFDSYLGHGFTPGGFFRERVDLREGADSPELSIRRQSEGAFAVLYYLGYEKRNGRSHPEWERRIRTLLDNFLTLQRDDHSFPRKFDDAKRTIDSTGGSSSCAVLPLSMACKYWDDARYLEAAQRTAEYIRATSVDRGEYFSSTLDARCEDKEASLYVTTAFYYLWLAGGGQQREYVDQALRSAYFALSYYYTWDVPFAPGQMLGDIGFRTRGWGNVSVENNHVDAYIFEFCDILDWLSPLSGDPRLGKFAAVIRSSMQDQLLPEPGRMCGIGKEGYYPEVVQHTAWDYGRNGKGFYNNIFAPGWVVASLWTMLSPGHAAEFFEQPTQR